MIAPVPRRLRTNVLIVALIFSIVLFIRDGPFKTAPRVQRGLDGTRRPS